MKFLTAYKTFLFSSLILLGVCVIVFFVYSYHKEALLSKRLAVFLKDKNNLPIELENIIPGSWNRICFIKGNYNMMEQKNLDDILGIPKLIDVSDLLFDGYETYVVKFSPEPHVQRYSKVRIITEEFVVCSNNRKQHIVINNNRESIKELIF
jgi:hypothetical protein